MLYCTNIESIYNKVYVDIKKVLCLQSAASFLGLSRGLGIPMKFYYVSDENIINSSYLLGLKRDTLDSIRTVSVRGIECTSKEYTIIDLIINCDMVDDQIIYESLARYYFENNEDISSLVKILPDGLQSRFNYYLEGAATYYDE